MLPSKWWGKACTRFGGPSVSSWGPAHCHPPQVACRDPMTCSALWGMPWCQASLVPKQPHHPGLGAWALGPLRASSLLPAGWAALPSPGWQALPLLSCC